MKYPRVHVTMGEEKTRRARRPAAHFLGLDEAFRTLETAWDLAEVDAASRKTRSVGAAPARTFANALRCEVAAFTGLRIGELHNLRPNDLRPDGSINVRMLRAEDSPWGRGLKYAKPRLTSWVNGGDESPTLSILRTYIAEHGIGPEQHIWPSAPNAWWHWVVHRLGPATGLQRLIEKLDGNDADEGAPRYLIHPHTFRAIFVMLCRRWPRRLGEPPVPWDTICALGGWDSVDCIQRNYYFAELDEHLAAFKASLPPAMVAPRMQPRDLTPKKPRAPFPSELSTLKKQAAFFRGPLKSR